MRELDILYPIKQTLELVQYSAHFPCDWYRPLLDQCVVPDLLLAKLDLEDAQGHSITLPEQVFYLPRHLVHDGVHLLALLTMQLVAIIS